MMAQPSYPPHLQAQVSHAYRFVHTLRALPAEALPSDAALLWLEGRADEVAAFTFDVIRGWSSAEITASGAASAIDDYLHTLHTALAELYGNRYAPPCCGPISSTRARIVALVPRRRADTLADTATDVSAADLGGG